MTKFILGLFLGVGLMSISACDNIQSTGADNYRFTTPEYEITEQQMVFIVHPTMKDLRDALRKRYIEEGSPVNEMSLKTVAAWSTIYPDKNVCEVHFLNPADKYAPEFLGHEVTHCIYGRFHEDQNEIK
jgi:hypothetical protein